MATGTTSRRRGEELESAIFEAVLVELAEVGFTHLTMEGVAARARTSKPVLYRRWPGRAELVLAAFGHNLPPAESLPDTGDLRTDLRRYLSALARRFDAVPISAVHGLLLETLRDPDLAPRFREMFSNATQWDYLRSAYQRAAERGEINGERITPRTIALPLTLLREEFLLTGVFPSHHVINEILDDVVLPLLRG
jgi:AcrR family transcriptional regulator